MHGSVRAASIFTSDSGEWKLAGLEILSSMKEDDAVIFTQGSLVPDIGRYTPPEIAKSGWDAVRTNPIHAVDSYGYGILVTEVFNGGFSGSDQIGNTKNIPLTMQTSYKRLTHAVPKMRLSIGHFLEQGSRSGGFFDTPLIELTDGIENLGLKSDSEREAFLRYVESVFSLGTTHRRLLVNWKQWQSQTTSQKNSSESRSCQSFSSLLNLVAADLNHLELSCALLRR